MMPIFSLCVPFRTDHGHRARVYAWLRQYYQHALPMAEWVPGHDDGDGTPVNRSLMRNRAAAAATTDLLCFMDADALIAPDDILTAVNQVQSGAKMVRFRGLHWLTPHATETILQQSPIAGMPLITVKRDTEEQTMDFAGFFFGLTRQTFDDMGGFDPRCEEWGEEDPCFNIVSDVLNGTTYFITSALFHLWHDPSARNTGSPSFLRNQAMTEEYSSIAATNDPEIMRRYCHERPPFLYDPKKRRRDVLAIFRFHHAICFTSITGQQYTVANGYEGTVPTWVRGTDMWRQFRIGENPVIECLVDDLLEDSYAWSGVGQ